MDYEETLEDAVIDDPAILGIDLLVIGRQIRTDLNRPLDLLGLDEDGRLHVVELKRGRTPRDVVAQTLEYGSWAAEQTFEEIVELFERRHDVRLEQAFGDHFGRPLEGLHEEHQLLIVAAEMDPTTERITRYLADVIGAPIDIALFRCFEDEGRVYLSRTWVAESQVESTPSVVRRSRVSRKSADDAWNGQDFIVNISHTRRWEDSMRYGFLGAGGGPQWINPLRKIHVGARVFPYVTRSSEEDGSGFVGVGRVTQVATPITHVTIKTDDGPTRLVDVLGERGRRIATQTDPDRIEHVILVDWENPKPLSEGYFETGMVAIPASAFKLKHKFTKDKLYEHFGVGAED